jgi:class 3 adenylate cyclase
VAGLLDREFYYRWEARLQSSPDKYWPLIADTNRFNRDTGLPTLDNLGKGDPALRNAHRKLRIFRFGIPVTWIEEPFEWVRPHRFGVVRRYSTGPVREMRVLANLNEIPGGGTQFSYEVWVYPANLLGLLAIPMQVGVLSAIQFQRAFRKYDESAKPESPFIGLTDKDHLAPRAWDRLRNAGNRLREHGVDQRIIDNLNATLSHGDDLTVSQMRPYQMSDLWKDDRQAVLKGFLYATREGVLDLRWHLLCPSCRVAKGISTSLRDLPRDVHCDTCQINFDVNFDQAVELTFKPNSAIREVDDMIEFCIAGPQVTPHVSAQQLLAPHTERLIEPVLQAGRYRIRTLEHEGAQYMRVSPTGAKEVRLVQNEKGWDHHEMEVSQSARLTLVNNTGDERLFLLEHVAWSDQAATAAEVIALQSFRDLFSDEALRPGEQFSVGKMAIAFTDLRSSTKLYREIGDATAFGYVLEHYKILQDAIEAEGGALIKTIGDAVLAVFRRPISAARAMQSAQKRLAQPVGSLHPLSLKVGIHYGPCIAVTLNERLDYFGSTVNLASRLVDLSDGADLIFSSAIIDDPEVNAWLTEGDTPGLLTPFREDMLKGFEDEPYRLWRFEARKVRERGIV